MTARAIQTPAANPSQRPASLRAVSAPGVAPRPLRPRATIAFYAACGRALEGEQVVWDVGCGDGQGTLLLAGSERRVLGIDPDLGALETARTLGIEGSEAAVDFSPEPPTVADPERAPDLIVVSDVLGYVEHPDLLLLQLCSCAKPTTTLQLWEPRSEPTQQLPSGKHRAFSQRELQELAAVAGWQVHTEPDLCSSFVALTAVRAPQPVVQMLSRLALDLPEPADFDETEVALDLIAAIHLRRAHAALQNRDGNAATTHFLNALQAKPDHGSALCGLAQLSLVCGSNQDALCFLRKCLDQDPTNVAAMQLWVHFLELASPDERLAGYQVLANLNPSGASALSALAQLHAEKGDALLAIQDLERLRRYHPTPSLDLSLTLGWLLYSVGRKSDAEVEARLASLMDPDGPDVKELFAALDV